MPIPHHNQSMNKFLHWNEVEKLILNEIIWLRNNIETFHKEEKSAPVTCNNCLLRKIAILLISGKVTATEISKSSKSKGFWIENNLKNKKLKIYHGSDWHREMMEKIENHFSSQGFDVIREPTLQWGRADLGVYKKGERDLLIEVGTTSLFKFWLNLEKMKNTTYLIVPNDEKIIEFICN
ncbi:MAG: hypothetical protein Q7R46_00930 [bacterium]|nr:hypothetical protein [bacterium]